MSEIDTSYITLPLSFPILNKTNCQSYSDKLVFELSNKLDLPISFISLASNSDLKKLSKFR